MSIASVRTKKIEWIDIAYPTREEGKYLRKRFNFHPLEISDCLSITQSPKIDVSEDHLFFILHFPTYSRENKQIQVDELNIFITSQALITVHRQAYKPLESLFQNCKTNIYIRHEFMNEGTGYLMYRILNILSKNMFPILDKISELLRQTEKSIYEEETRDVLMDLAVIRRDILTLRRIIEPQRHVLQNLSNLKKDFLGKDSEIYYGDVLDKFTRASILIENYHSLVKGYSETNEAIISHKTNDLIKFFTIVSAGMVPFYLLAGIYSMNIGGLPWAKSPYSFWILMIVIVITTGLAFLYMKKKKYL